MLRTDAALAPESRDGGVLFRAGELPGVDDVRPLREKEPRRNAGNALLLGGLQESAADLILRRDARACPGCELIKLGRELPQRRDGDARDDPGLRTHEDLELALEGGRERPRERRQ